MVTGRDHNLSSSIERLCRRIFSKGITLDKVDRSVVGSSMDADSIDNFELKQALCVAFAPHFHDLSHDVWKEIEFLLDKYSSAIYCADDRDYETYNKLCQNALEETKDIADKYNLIK